jgi:hypothetical protein
MSDPAAEPFPDDATAPTSATARALAELECRVQALELRVASLPDTRQIEEHVTERVKASLPVPPPVEPVQPPSFKDITLPIPNVQTIVTTAKTTWTLFEMIGELKLLFWTLVDRRYHMAWVTRVITIALLVAILTSHWWLPFAGIEIIGGLWEKLINLAIGLVMFLVLHHEMRRYQEWLGKR